MFSIGTRSSIIVLLWCFAACYGTNDQYRLITKLFAAYDRNVLPVENNSVPVTVKLGMALNQIIDLDERNQVLTIKAWMRYRWSDANLKWNSSEYGGVDNIRVDATRIWRPDITLYSDLRESASDVVKIYPVTVNSDGSVVWNVPEMLHSACDLDVTNFPWDEQRCLLKFGSWTYDASKIDLTNLSAAGDMGYFTGSGEWTFVDFPLKHKSMLYSCCKYPYPEVTFYVIIRRKPLYYLFNLILPAVFITATTVLVFYLPPESGEKVSLGVTVLLALTVFLLLVAEIMPPQSDSVPLIGQYFEATIVLLALSTALTVVILNIHHRGKFANQVPFWIRKVVLDWLARPLCLKDKVDIHLSKAKSNKVSNDNDVIENGHVNQVMRVEEMPSYPEVKKPDAEDSPGAEALNTIRDILVDFKREHKGDQLEEACHRDWMLVAMVIDRFLLLVFVALTVIVTAVILSNHPTFIDGVYDPIV